MYLFQSLETSNHKIKAEVLGTCYEVTECILLKKSLKTKKVFISISVQVLLW